MRQDFNKLIEKLKNDKLTGVSVFDVENYKIVLKPTLGSDIKSQYGSVENFFEKLKTDKINSVIVQEYRQNGTGIKKIGNPLPTLNFGEKQNQLQPVATTSHVAQVMPQAQNHPLGLGFVDQVNLFADQRDKIRLEVENTSLKRELEEAKKLRDEYKEQILQDKYDINKQSGNAEMATGLAQTILPMLAEFMKKPSGLNAPAIVPAHTNFSEVKKHLYNLLELNQISDSTVQVLLSVLQNLNDAAFYQSLIELMQPNTTNNE